MESADPIQKWDLWRTQWISFLPEPRQHHQPPPPTCDLHFLHVLAQTTLPLTPDLPTPGLYPPLHLQFTRSPSCTFFYSDVIVLKTFLTFKTLYIIKCTDLKCVVWWLSTKVESLVTLTQIKTQTTSVSPKCSSGPFPVMPVSHLYVFSGKETIAP